MNITKKAQGIIDSCRFCWMCRHVCPIGNATGQERNTARARALASSLVVRGAESIQEIIDNIYECALCGACTNNCVTGWDPKVFIKELKTEAILSGVIPSYVDAMLKRYIEYGNVYGKTPFSFASEESDVLFYIGTDAAVFAKDSVKCAIELLKKSGSKFTVITNAPDSGEQLYFLTGKTAETQQAMKTCAETLNKYKKVIVYDPMDLKLFLHEYKEWGIEIKAEIIGFNSYLSSMLERGELKVKKSEKEYSLQDNFAYSRDLDDSVTARKILSKIGVLKEMLLIGKEANFAGSLLMNEYMPDVMKRVAEDRWQNAIAMECKTVVTENPSEYVMLKNTAPSGYTVISIERAITENLID